MSSRSQALGHLSFWPTSDVRENHEVLLVHSHAILTCKQLASACPSVFGALCLLPGQLTFSGLQYNVDPELHTAQELICLCLSIAEHRRAVQPSA